MRLTEAQIRRTVRGILREATYPDYPEPDRKISAVIDSIGEKIRREVAADPYFDIARNYAEPEDDEQGYPGERDRDDILGLFVREHMREVMLIARLMTRQAQLLAPIVLRDKDRLKAGLPSNIVLQRLESFTGEIDDVLDQSPAYVDDEVFGSLDRLETGIIICLDALLFPAPNEHPSRRANQLSELTDERVYHTLLGLYNYTRPSLRG